MVSCQEPSPLKGSTHSLQCHPHDAALVNAHSFVSMGVEAMCCPCHSAALHRHMKRQPSLCNCCPCRGHCHCDCCRRLRCRCQFCCNCRRRCPLPLPLLPAITIAVAIDHCCRRLCCIAVSRCHRRCPCHRQLPSLSPLVIAVAISVGHHLPLPLAIAESCCLGGARIVFKQFKQ
jgi:hypothetical protein